MASDRLRQSLSHALQLRLAGRLDEAEKSLRALAARNPGDAILCYNLANVLRDQKKLSDAAQFYSAAIRLQPAFAEAHMGLSCIFFDQAKFAEAAAACVRAVELQGDNADFHRHLGATYARLGNLPQAADELAKTLSLRPSDVAARLELGNVFWHQRNYAASAAEFRRIIEQCPTHAGAFTNLATALWKQGRLDDALSAASRAVELQPNWPAAHANLGGIFREQGKIPEALACHDRALALDPQNASMHSNRNSILLCIAGDDRQKIFAEHKKWNDVHAPRPQAANFNAANRSSDRKLRIGYVSPDFRDHPVGRFILPALEHRDAEDFDVYCYSDVAQGDWLTQRIAAAVGQFRPVASLSNDRVAELIAADQIDILVDLAGHTAGNRLLLFARRAAPVQATYLGYPATTGLTAMDDRLTDSLADPPGQTEAFHSESLIRLDPCAWCFTQPGDSPPPNSPPAAKNGYITFGCFNSLAKVSDFTLALWSAVLQAVDSRLLLKARGLKTLGARQRIIEAFARRGIGEERLTLLDWTATAAEHLEMYRQIDIALDTYPYHGTTTTCEALWMGVPVITLAGPTHVCRVGVSLLTNAGLPEMVALSEGDFVNIAHTLAADLGGLSALRAELRGRLLRSPLTNVRGFNAALESAFQRMWRNCVESGKFE